MDGHFAHAVALTQADVQPAASNIQTMIWDNSLQAVAEKVAKRCTIMHSNEPGVGENIFFAQGNAKTTVIEAINKWVE